jgi:polysaccharide transporter, PST family
MILMHAPLLFFAYAYLTEILTGSIMLIIMFNVNHLSILRWKLNLSLAKSLLHDSWPLMLSGIVIMIYMRVDQILLGSMLGNKSVGLYSAAVRISEITYFIPMAMSSSVYPSLINAKKSDETKYKQRLQLYYIIVALLSILFIITTFGFAKPFIFLLYGSKYAGAVPALQIHIWTTLFVFIGVANNFTYMIIENYQRLQLFNSIIGASTNFLLNIILIPYFGVTGAAIAALGGQGSAFFSQIFFPKLRKNFFLQFRALILLDLFIISRAKLRGVINNPGSKRI